mmetsp:Transcript_11315/g.11410  ORF Transcript_11315/g.11410 Transcript_11315/m.11410 type:complete len:112 (-) Transcript_11315:609-944(-)
MVAMLLNEHPIVPNTLTFEPAVSETCMVHGYLRWSLVDCETARDEVFKELVINVLNRMRSTEQLQHEHDGPVDHGFRTRFEWAIGGGNYHIDDSVFLNGLSTFASRLQSMN